MSYAQVPLINKEAAQTHCKLSSLAALFSGGQEAVPTSTLSRKSTRSTWPTFGRVHSLGNTNIGGQVEEKLGKYYLSIRHCFHFLGLPDSSSPCGHARLLLIRVTRSDMQVDQREHGEELAAVL